MSSISDEIAEQAKVVLTEESNWMAPMWVAHVHVTINGLDPDEWYRRMYRSRSRTMRGRHIWPKKSTDDH